MSRPGERWARVYFGVQATAGAVWWVAVFASPFVRETTLGSLDAVAIAALDIPLFVLASAVAAFGVKPAAWLNAGWTVLVAGALGVWAAATGEAGWGVLLMVAAAAASVLALALLVLGYIPTRWIVAGPFTFRLAASRDTVAAHLAATFGQIAVFWGFFLGVLPLAVAFLERRWGLDITFPSAAIVAGAIVFTAASALGIWSGITMAVRGDGTPLPAAMPNRLVIAGPYRYIRNPMATAGIVQGAAVGLMLSSWLVIVYAIVGSMIWNYAVRPLEEADLEERFGAEFGRYRDTVRCWVPRLRAAPIGVKAP
jgi:protein-S-isoprenylcysteine O-methyltransferase Ste14